jgi:hypothetical protein
MTWMGLKEAERAIDTRRTRYQIFHIAGHPLDAAPGRCSPRWLMICRSGCIRPHRDARLRGGKKSFRDVVVPGWPYETSVAMAPGLPAYSTATLA